MLINQNRNTKKITFAGIALPAAILLITGCAQHARKPQGPHAHERARFDMPEHRTAPDAVPYGATDWNAVKAALGGAGKMADYSKAMWASTGGRLVDVAAGRIVSNPPGLPGRNGYAWPANGKISRGFRPADNHKGLDITADIGVPIHAARAGKVIYASNELSGFGNCIIIQHDENWTTFYAHNNQNFVRPGDVVQCGQLIAEVGKTGRATGPHLHFEIRHNGTPLDPHPMLP